MVWALSHCDILSEFVVFDQKVAKMGDRSKESETSPSLRPSSSSRASVGRVLGTPPYYRGCSHSVTSPTSRGRDLSRLYRPRLTRQSVPSPIMTPGLFTHKSREVVKTRDVGVGTPKKIPGMLCSPESDVSTTVKPPLRKIKESLAHEFDKLRPDYSVRCKFRVCAMKSSLEELWCNNLTVVGRVLRHMMCLHCSNEYLVFSSGGKSLLLFCFPRII